MVSGHFPAPKKKILTKTRQLPLVKNPKTTNGHHVNGHHVTEETPILDTEEQNTPNLGEISSVDSTDLLRELGELNISENGHTDEEEDDDTDKDDSESEVLNDLNLIPTGGGDSGTPNIMDFLSSGGGGGDASSDIVKELLSKENLLMKTDLPSAAIPYVSQVLSLAIKYDAKNLLNRMWMYLQLRVSVDRQGRKEVVAAALRVRGNRDDDDF